MSLESHPSNRRDGVDDYDELFDYDIDATIPDLDLEVDNPNAKASNASSKSKGKDEDDLGVDEEIKVRKRRVTVKLDAERLLSEQGLPRLKRAPQELTPKLKGKGHEYKDAAKILNYYQLWADDLFRKGNFRDTLAIIEKLGHGKRVQIARQELVDSFYKTEGPPTPNEDTDQPIGPTASREREIQGDVAPDEEMDSGALFHGGGYSDSDMDIEGTRGVGGLESMDNTGIPDDDEMDALLQMEGETPSVGQQPKETATNSIFGNESGRSRMSFSVEGTPATTPFVVAKQSNQSSEPVEPVENIEDFPDEFDDDFVMDDWDAVDNAEGSQVNSAGNTVSAITNNEQTQDCLGTTSGEGVQSKNGQRLDHLDDLEEMYGLS